MGRSRASIDNPTARIKNRALGFRHHVDGLLNAQDIAIHLGLVGAVFDVLGANVFARFELNVLWHVDNHRAGPAMGRHIKGLMDDPRQILDALHQIVMLGAMAGNANRITFLKRIRADQMGWNLPGEAHQRNGIEQRISQPCDGVGCTGARRDQHHAHFAR